MSRISREEIAKVALLSRLSFSPEEAELFAGQLSKILAYAEKINELDTENIEPTSHCLSLTNVFREDTEVQSLDPAQALSNAPEVEGQCFRVPKIIQEF